MIGNVLRRVVGKPGHQRRTKSIVPHFDTHTHTVTSLNANYHKKLFDYNGLIHMDFFIKCVEKYFILFFFALMAGVFESNVYTAVSVAMIIYYITSFFIVLFVREVRRRRNTHNWLTVL